MKYFITGLSMLLITVLVRGALAFLHRPRKGEKGKVMLPTFFAVLGLIGSAPFIAASVYTALTDEPIWIPICFLAFSMLGLSLVIAYINCRITYDEEGFTHRSFFGIKRKYKYEDITAVKYGDHEDFIYVGKRRLMVDEFAIGGLDFFRTANKQYRRKFGFSIPKKPRNKQLFSPDVQDTGTLICIWVAMAVLALAWAGGWVYVLVAVPANTGEIILAIIMMVLPVIGMAVLILATINMARFPERYKEKTIRLWLYRDYSRSSSGKKHRKRH